jgi:hypothetical protein
MKEQNMIEKIKNVVLKAQAYAKLVASIAGGLLAIGVQFIPSEYTALITAIILAVTAFSVYQFPNITDGVENGDV